MGDPLSTTAVFAFLNSAFKFTEYAVKLYSVDSENGVFVRMIQRVRLDLEETERLVYSPSVRSKLVATPGKLPWIKGVILSTKGALNEIGRWVERVRSDKEGYGSISWENRVRWVFNDNEKLINRRMELGTCHQALSTVLAYLAPLEQAATPFTVEPPEYQDATFLDDLLSPRQRRKARDLGKRDEGTSKETQKTQVPASAVSPLNPIAHRESQREENIGAVNDADLSQNLRHHSLPTPSTSERLSFVPPVSSPGTSTAFPILNTKTSFTKPAAQEGSSNRNPLPATILSPGSVSNILTRSLSSSIPVSSEHSSIAGPSATTSLMVPWAQANSLGYVGQVALPASYPSPQPWQKTPSVVSVSTGEPAQGTASQHHLDASRNSLKSLATYIAYSLPSTQPPTSAPQYSGSARPLSPVVHSTSIPSCQAISSELPCSPGHTLQGETQNLSATNTLGPVNAFELYSDPEAQATLGDCNRPLNESLHSQQAGLEPSQSTHLSLYPEQNRSPRATYLDSAAATESLAETIADPSVQRPENQAPLADMPNNLVFAQPQSGDSFKELSTTISWEQTATSRFEMSGDASTDHFVGPNFTKEVLAAGDNDMDELHDPRQRAVSHASTFVEISPPTGPQLSQSRYRYRQPMASWLNAQAQAPRTQPKYHAQYQYRAYSPPSPVLTFRSTTSSVVPSPILSEQGHWAGPTSTSPPMEAATQVQPAASTIEQGHPLSRSMTAGEVRRRNQKTLLNLIGRGVTGDKESSI